MTATLRQTDQLTMSGLAVNYGSIKTNAQTYGAVCLRVDMFKQAARLCGCF